MEKKPNEFLELIKSRKAVKNYAFKKIHPDIIKKIIEYASWARIENDSQPWRVNVVEHPTLKRMLSELSEHGGILESATINLVIFLDRSRAQEGDEDLKTIGAFTQNILLCAHAMKLGAIWISYVKEKVKVNEMFKLNPEKYEFMGIIALGLIDDALESKEPKPKDRRPVKEFIEWF